MINVISLWLNKDNKYTNREKYRTTCILSLRVALSSSRRKILHITKKSMLTFYHIMKAQVLGKLSLLETNNKKQRDIIQLLHLKIVIFCLFRLFTSDSELVL